MMVLITFSPSLHAHVTSVQQGWMHIYEDDTHNAHRDAPLDVNPFIWTDYY